MSERCHLRLGKFHTHDEPIVGFRHAGPGTGTPLTKMSGRGAITFPSGSNDQDLPIGAQLSAASGHEDLLRRVTSQLETARRPADRRPPIHL
ncbi:MAG: hypothetical protein ACLPVY_21390 [Acidimicrobiia bacterium]